MTLLCHGVLDNDLNHLPIYGGDAAVWSMDSSVAPAQGDYFLYAQGNGSAVGQPSFGSPQDSSVGTYVWYVQRQMIVGGTRDFASGDIIAFMRIASGSAASGNFWYLVWKYVTATTAKVALYYNGTQQAESSGAVITRGTAFTVRMQWDGSTCKVWIDGTEEISVSYPGGAATPSEFHGNWLSGLAAVMGQSLPTNQWHKFAGAAMFSSSVESDRPGTTTYIKDQTPNGNSAVGGETDAGDEGDCTDTSQGDYTKWNKYPGTPSESTFNCFPASDLQEVSTLDTFTLPGGGINIVACQPVAWCAANVDSKTVNTWMRMLYSGSNAERANTNISGTAFGPKRGVIDSPPGGGSWTQTVIDGLELGIRSSSGNGANAEVAALANLVVGVDSDPPTVTTNYRLASSLQVT